MNKQEYKLLSEEIMTLTANEQFQDAAEIADRIDWRKVRSFSMLMKISELYQLNRRYEDALELMLIAVDPEYRNRGVHAMLFNEIIPIILECGFKYGESNAEMETNNAIQNVWNIFEKEFKRRRRVYSKPI